MRKLFALALAATMVFTNSILAGETLVRDSIRSEGYVAGSNGWSINRNGTAEFNDVTSRGEVIVGDEATKYISITNDPQPIIKLGTPSNVEETSPASIDELATGFSSFLFLSSPERNSSGDDATISLIATDDPKTQISQVADEIFNTAGTVFIGAGGSGDELVVSVDGNSDYVIRQNGEIWNDLTLQNSWVEDSSAVNPEYMKDANGHVHVRGAVKNGSTTVIGTLPAGYRPQGQTFWVPGQHAGTSTAASFLQVDTNGVITITTNLASAQTRLRLGFSFPTFN